MSDILTLRYHEVKHLTKPYRCSKCDGRLGKKYYLSSTQRELEHLRRFCMKCTGLFMDRYSFISVDKTDPEAEEWRKSWNWKWEQRISDIYGKQVMHR